MKRITIITFAIIAISASCSKAEFDAPESNVQVPSDVELADGQILCAIPQPKTALDANLNVIWSDSDEIMVLGGENQSAKYRFASFATDDKKSAVFENIDPKVTGSRAAIYPASAYVNDSYDGQTAQITLGGVQELSMPVGAVSSVLSPSTGISALPLVSTPSEETLSFSNLFGGIMFRPYDYMGMDVKFQKLSVSSVDGKALAGTATINVATGAITGFEGEEQTTLTYKCSDTPSIYGKKRGFVAYLPAGEYPNGLEITMIDNMGRKFPVKTAAITINAGKVKTLAELPLTIWYGETNCIVVAPGTTEVTIDATPHYTWRGDYKAEATADNVIRVENGNMSGLGGVATVLWQQEEGSTLTDLTGTTTTEGPIVNGVITVDRKLTEGKTLVKVPLTGTKGNAVIALRSVLNNENIVWSFHIWVSEINDVACNTTSMGSYSLLDRNLGATKTDGSLDSFGVSYQWGRKDPFPRHLYAQSGTSVKGDLLKTMERTSSVDINTAITAPDTRIIYTLNTSGAKWLPNERILGSWGCPSEYGDSGNANKVKTTVKTVFDPCPAGYKVPALGYLSSLAGINTKDNAVVGKGYNMKTGSGDTKSFFPYSGYIRVCKDKTANSNDYQSYRGYMWTAVNRNNNQGAYIFWYNGDGIQANKESIGANIYSYLGDALPVRCIKE